MCQKHKSQLAQESLSCSTVFFSSLSRLRYLSFFSDSFNFILCSAGTAKSTILQILFFWLIIIRSCLLDGIYYYYSIYENIVHVFPYICSSCNRCYCKEGARWPMFKFWTRLLAFYLALIPLRNVCIKQFSPQVDQSRPCRHATGQE